MLDQPASSEALWRIYDQTGVRPEYLLPVLFVESGFRPEAPNGAGYDYWGLNQVSGGFLRNRGIEPRDYLTWPASKQLTDIVLPYMRGQAPRDTLRSGLLVYVANFWPVALKGSRALDRVILRAPNGPCTRKDPYCANQAFDIGKKGYITLGDLAAFVQRASTQKPVREAIAAAYALRPSETPRDATLGEDPGGVLPTPPPRTEPPIPLYSVAPSTGAGPLLAGALLVAAGAGVAWSLRR